MTLSRKVVNYRFWAKYPFESDSLLCTHLAQDSLPPHVKLFGEPNFDELGLSVDLLGPVLNTEEVGHGVKTQSVNVMGGV